MKFRDLLKVCNSSLFIYDSKCNQLMAISLSALKKINNKKLISLFSEEILDSEVESVESDLQGLTVRLFEINHNLS